MKGVTDHAVEVYNHGGTERMRLESPHAIALRFQLSALCFQPNLVCPYHSSDFSIRLGDHVQLLIVPVVGDAFVQSLGIAHLL